MCCSDGCSVTVLLLVTAAVVRGGSGEGESVCVVEMDAV